MAKKKKLKINLTYNTPSEEAIERFVNYVLLKYTELIEKEKNSTE